MWQFKLRSLEASRKFGIEVKDADELQEEGVEMEQQIQVEYTVLLERAVGASLEGKIEEVKRLQWRRSGLNHVTTSARVHVEFV